MKKELTIEHLAAYLPYDVQVVWGDSLIPQSLTPRNFPNNWSVSKNFRLCLRPISDLTREITHNGETFVPIKKLCWVEKWGDDGMGEIVYCQYGENPRTTVNVIDYIKDLQMICSWHFDTFGLIESGLAEPIPSIQQP
jgi:hypothetical protein